MNTYYSIPLSTLCDNDGYPLQAIPELAYGDVAAVVFSAVDANNTLVDLSAATHWQFLIDTDRTVETSPLCEVSSDKIIYDAVNKTLSFSIDSKTLPFLQAVNGKSQLMLIAELSGYDASNNRIFRFDWNMIGVMPISGGAVPSEPSIGTVTPEITAFKVFANSTAYAVGDTIGELGNVEVVYEIPAQMTHKFIIRSMIPQEQNDIIVDWGDGSTSRLQNGTNDSGVEFIQKKSDGEFQYLLTHTYAVQGVFKVQIIGQNYFAIKQTVEIGPYSNCKTLTERTQYNLLCACLNSELPVASHLANLSSFAIRSLRLFEVNALTFKFPPRISHTSNMFSSCRNLKTFVGFYLNTYILKSLSNMFANCANMEICDMEIPSFFTNTSSLGSIFTGCEKLTADISELIPAGGFGLRKISMSSAFSSTPMLTGTVPADLLWEDTSKVWLNTSKAFSNSSAEIRAQVPTSWGGTNTEIQA